MLESLCENQEGAGVNSVNVKLSELCCLGSKRAVTPPCAHFAFVLTATRSCWTAGEAIPTTDHGSLSW